DSEEIDMSDKPAAPASAPSRASMKKELPEHFRSYKHVWVFVEIERGSVHPVSFELLGAGRKLADSLGVELACVVLGAPGETIKQTAAEAFAYGADVAYLVEDEILADYRNEPYSQAMTQLVNATSRKFCYSAQRPSGAISRVRWQLLY